MSRIALAASLTFAACCAVAGVAGPLAAADPEDGGSAQSVIDDLQSKGYLVQINWVNGQDTKPLALCTVAGVNNPGDLPPGKATVYVDVMCPNHDY